MPLDQLAHRRLLAPRNPAHEHQIALIFGIDSYG
jgi:hypothetical protein